MIPQISEINFPVDANGHQIATLSSATVSMSDMGDKNITASVKVDGGIKVPFEGSDGEPWQIEFRGERYIQPLLIPQASKGNDSLFQVFDLTFQHWAIYQMKRFFFCTLAPIESSTAIADKYIASLTVDLPDFAKAIDEMLEFYFPDRSVYVHVEDDSYINPLFDDYDKQRKTIEISYSYIWEVLQKTYELFDCHWEIRKDDNDNYAIWFGYPVEDGELTHVFQYGYEGGLMRIERQVQDDNIRNQILGRGGEKNLPYMYFKDYEKFHPNSTSSAYENIGDPDPDAIPELENVYFDHLRDSNFRSYIQGWKVNPHRQASTEDGWSVTWDENLEFLESDGTVYSFDAERAEEDWAYAKGASDETFDPVEYVKDDESIEKYGLLQAGLDDNEKVFPTIQGMTRALPCIIPNHGVDHTVVTRVDEVVDAEKVETDEIDTSDPMSKAVTEEGMASPRIDIPLASRDDHTINQHGIFHDLEIELTPTESDTIVELDDIAVREGYLGNILSEIAISVKASYNLRLRTGFYRDSAGSTTGLTTIYQRVTVEIPKENYTVTDFRFIEKSTGIEYTEGYTNIPAGVYKAVMTIHMTSATAVIYHKQDPDGRVTIPDGARAGSSMTAGFSFVFSWVKFNGMVVPNRNGIYHITVSATVSPNETAVVNVTGDTFTVPEGGALFIEVPVTADDKAWCGISHVDRLVNTATGQVVSSSNIPAGTYELHVEITFLNRDSANTHTFTATLGNAYVYFSTNAESWKPTFDIWIKNLFGTDRKAFPYGDAGDSQYVHSVWEKLQAAESQEMTVTFATGNLSGHSDWEFKVAKDGIFYDSSKSIIVLDDNGNEHEVQSEWRLRLIKSDAEAETIHKYVPYKDFDAHAGDLFFFTNIYLPWEYVFAAEQELNAVKTAELEKCKEILPTWVVRLDKVRVSEYDTNLINRIALGGRVKVKDGRFTEEAGVWLFVKSITITWPENYDSGIGLPDVDIVLSDEIETAVSTVERIQGDIETLSTQMRSITDLERAVRKVGDLLYLRKDGVDEVSYSPTQFARTMSSLDFRTGAVGGAGWAVSTDAEGKAVAEFDKVIIRDELQVNNLVVNQVSAVGGYEVMSAASMIVSKVIAIPMGDEEPYTDYECHFDQRDGTVGNLFVVGDIARSVRFDAVNNETSNYRMRVIEVGDDYIRLSGQYRSGNSVPQVGDTIVQYGNYTDEDRQNVIVRSVIGDGYEEMFTGLNSVTASGSSYYYAGSLDGLPTFWIGNQSSYINYASGEVNIKARVNILPGSQGADNILSWVSTDTTGDVTTIAGGAVLSNIVAVASDGEMVAGMSSSSQWADPTHGKVTFFSGTDAQTAPDDAPLQIYEDGHIKATSADIEGKIQSSEGKVGGFTIGEFSLEAKPNDPDDPRERKAQLRLSRYMISFEDSDFGQRAFLGTNVIPEPGPDAGVFRAEVNQSSTIQENAKNICAYLSAMGTNRKNYAVYAPYGMFAGLRPVTQAVSANRYLTSTDFWLIVTAQCTLTLPAAPQDGQTYFIMGTSGMYSTMSTISGNTKNILKVNSLGSESSSQVFGKGLFILVFDASQDKWFMASIT